MANLRKTTRINVLPRKEIKNPAAGKKAPLEAKQYQRMRQSFFTNLLLLGFDKEANEKKDNVLYNEDTFLVANNKGALTILHFLLNKLDPDECQFRLRGIWPVFDKKQEQSFRKETCSWLNKISLEDSEANFSHLNPSLFLSPGGYRFQLFLFQLSEYVMLRLLQRTCGVSKSSYLRRPVLKTQGPQLTNVQVKILKSANVKHMRSHVDNVEQFLQVYNKWHEQLREMVKNYRILCKKVRALERKEKQNMEEKKSVESWSGDKIVKMESLKTVREDWLKLRKTMESQNEECEIIKSILQNIASRYKIDLNQINALIPDLLHRVQEHKIQEQQIDNLYKEGKLNLVSLVQLLNLSLEMYNEKLKSVGLPNTEENIAPMQQKLETHFNLLQNIQTLRDNMKEQLHLLKATVQESAEVAAKKAIDQKLLPMEFSLNAPTPPRNFHLLCDQSVPMDSPLSERLPLTVPIDTPEAAKKIQIAAKENALKVKAPRKVQRESVLDQLSFVPESQHEKAEEKKSKLPVKIADTFFPEEKESDHTPKVKSNRYLDKTSLRMQIQSLGVKIDDQNIKSKQTSCESDDSEMRKGVTIWADQIVEHVMGLTDVVPQNVNEALSMDAFKSRDKLARSPVKSNPYLLNSPYSCENIPQIEIHMGTPSPCRKIADLSPVSCLTESYSSSVIDSEDNDHNLFSTTAERRSSQTEKSLDISLDAYLQLPSNHKELNLDIFDDVPYPKMHFNDLNSREDISDCMALTSPPLSMEDNSTPLKFDSHSKSISKSDFLDEKPAKNNQNYLYDSILSASMSTYNSSIKTDKIFEDADPTFLVPGDQL